MSNIKSCDILLFKSPPFPSVGWFISKYSISPYSHVGLATIEDGKVYVVEFREFIGSRIYPLEKYLEEGAKIDVFRCAKEIFVATENGYLKKEFTDEIANNIIKFAKSLVGQPYGWKLIWKMAKAYFPFIRLAQRPVFKDKNGENIYVCSTLVTYSFRKFFLDPVPYLSDSYTKPGDIARSSLFNKIMSL